MTDRPSHRRLPPLTALRALEALHLAGSVTGAASRLRISHSAISHQVRLLEAWSDTPLFARVGRTTRLTAAGRSLADTAHDAFDSIRHEVDRLPLRRLRPVAIAALPLVATELILPRLPAFLDAEPGIHVHLTLALADRPSTPPPDIEIVFVRRVAMLAGDVLLLPGDAVPACRPDLLARFGDDWEALAREGPLIHDEDLRMWSTWREITGRPSIEPQDGARTIFEGSGLIQEAVFAGLGAGFVRTAVIGRHVASVRLAVWATDPIDTDWAYVVRIAPRMADDAAVRTVVGWLCTNAEASPHS